MRNLSPPGADILLESVKKNDEEKIKSLLDVEANKSLLTYVYPDSSKTIFLTACSEKGVTLKTIKTLLDLGVNIEGNAKCRPLHLAAQNPNSHFLKTLIDKASIKKHINKTVEGNTALHSLIKSGVINKENEENFCRNIELLLNAGINVNQADFKDLTAIFWAAKNGYKEVIKTILTSSRDLNVLVDLDNHKLDNTSARDLIINNNLYDEPLPADTVNQSGKDKLFSLIKRGEETKFITEFKNLNQPQSDDFDVNWDDGTWTLLQYCCEKGLSEAAKYLLDNKAKIDNIKNGEQTLIELAAKNGYYEIFKMLVDRPDVKVSLDIVFYLLKNFDNPKFAKINHEKCCKIIFKKLDNLDPNAKDELENTLIHYALRYSDEAVIHNLLKRGASLAYRNYFGTMPIEDIKRETLACHLDDCVELSDTNKNYEEQDFKVVLKYRTLLPPRKLKVNESDPKSSVIECSDAIEPETEVIEPITSVPEAEVIDDTAPETENIELIISVPEAEGVYDKTPETEAIDDTAPETEVIAYMSKSPELRNLLNHPVIVSFLLMKWHRIRSSFYVNLIFNIFFVVSLTCYIFTTDSDSNWPVTRIFYYCILNVTFWILVSKEMIFQKGTISLKKYLKNFENDVKIFLFIITLTIMYICLFTSDGIRRQIASAAILLAAFEFVLVLGQHPELSTYVVILKTVSVNFFKLLIWSVWLIVAFGLSFHILFAQIEIPQKGNGTENGTDAENKDDLIVGPGAKTELTQKYNGTENGTDAEKKDDMFMNPGKSIFKTIIMLTGEFEAGSINFDTYQPASMIIFSLFVFTMTIILLNLINALAITDTQTIINNAKLEALIARAQYIYSIEKITQKQFLSAKKCIWIRPYCKLFLVKNICLFSSHKSENYQLTVKPNNNGQIFCDSDSQTRSDIHLDKETVKSIVAFARRKNSTTLKAKVETLKTNLDQVLGKFSQSMVQ